jgi:hypothetical protein
MLFDEPRIVPGRRIAAEATLLLAVTGEDFVTASVPELALGFDGIPADRHRGWTRPADSRVPWYQRGTPIRNTRQVSIVASDELAEIAQRMDLPDVRPEWLGANIVLGGVPRLSRLPAGTTMLFANGAALRVEAINAPCRLAGGSVARHFPGRTGIDTAFPQQARGLRGIVATVEREGTLRTGETATLLVPEQWIWEG